MIGGFVHLQRSASRSSSEHRPPGMNQARQNGIDRQRFQDVDQVFSTASERVHILKTRSKGSDSTACEATGRVGSRLSVTHVSPGLELAKVSSFKQMREETKVCSPLDNSNPEIYDLPDSEVAHRPIHLKRNTPSSKIHLT